MNVNVGTVDRVIRLIVGISLITLAAMGKIGPWGYIGIVPVLTGLTRRCPAYMPFGISTCGASRAGH